MAKKAKELTLEEKLEQALVPVEEQPYEVPGNWCWVRLNWLCDYVKAGGDKPFIFSDIQSEETPIPVVANGTINEGIIGYTDKPSESAGTVTIAGRGTIGYSVLRTYNYVPVVRLIVLKLNDLALPLYIKLIFDFFQEKGIGSSIPQLTVPMIKDKFIPIPPKAEQQRIVDQIRSLFVKLDEAKGIAEEIIDSFEIRKSAILHKAFTGELIGLSSGSTVSLETIIDMIRIGPFGSVLHKEDYVVGGIPVINPKHIVNQKIVAEEKVSISKKKASELASYILRSGDIIMGRRGEMGRSAPVTENEAGWLCGTGSLIIRLRTGYDATFYSQIIASRSTVQYLEENCVGSTMKNLNEKVIKDIPVPNFSESEQKTIIRVLNKLLEKEQQVKEAAEAALDQIDTMKKSILARAFRGELGTNSKKDIPAEEILRDILKEK